MSRYPVCNCYRASPANIARLAHGFAHWRLNSVKRGNGIRRAPVLVIPMWVDVSAEPQGKVAMIDWLINLLFHCRHRRLSRPMSPRSEPGVTAGGGYVVCLECGKRFAFDVKEMRRKPLRGSTGKPDDPAENL